MKNWCLQSADPGTFTIATDARFNSTSYTDDHIWSLSLEGGEPPALAIQTTFGLRAKNLRLFPRIVDGDTSYVDPLKFETLPRITRFFPNYLEVMFSPLPGIDVVSEYWVPNTNSLIGRLTILNSRLIHRRINLQWAALLTPTRGGQRMAPLKLDSKIILHGRTENLFPVLYLTGGPEIGSGPCPALSVPLELPPGDSRQFIWYLATSDTLEKSFDIAKTSVDRRWDAEIAKLEVINSGLLQIVTGDQDWNAAFALAQNCAIKLLLGATENISNTSFVLNRELDQGFSALGDGSDYNFLWSGQTALDTDYFTTFLLPAYPDLAKGLLNNFLKSQTSDGFIHYNIGLGGQRGTMLATPILVNQAWRIYQATEDITFLETVFPSLLNFIQSWFTKNQDRDSDGLPEWEHPSQSGYEDNPVFSHWDSPSLKAEITKTESPSLCSFLYNEIRLLKKIAKLLNQTKPIAALEAIEENLKVAVERSWDESVSVYRYWDRESHYCSQGEQLGQRSGSGEIVINRNFDPPIRLAIQFKTQNEHTKKINIFIHGVGISGNQRIEKLEADTLSWYMDQADAVSEGLYTSIEYIEISGADPEDIIFVGVMDLSVIDHTLLLPLWAEIPDDNQVSILIKNTITNPDVFWAPYGISAGETIASRGKQSHSIVYMIWNNLIGEGMLKYGYRIEAADLVTRLMNVVIINLKKHHSFYRYYDAKTGSGHGDRNMLRGLPPVNLFLKTLGVHIISPQKVYLQGKNPFPWPVTLRYKGLTVIREAQKTIISFPGGQTAVVKSNDPRMIQIESIK